METPKPHKLVSVEVTDDLGTYVNYNRRCNFRNCGEVLASRNRYHGYLLCRPCALIKDQVRYASTPRTPAEIADAAAKKAEPRRAEAHALLDAFLKHPTDEPIKQRLFSKLVDAELIARFRCL